MPDVSTGISDTRWIKNPLRKFGCFSMKMLTRGPVLLSFAACEIKSCLSFEKKTCCSLGLVFCGLPVSVIASLLCCCIGILGQGFGRGLQG